MTSLFQAVHRFVKWAFPAPPYHGPPACVEPDEEIVRLREGLRWIAAGKTGSYGNAQAFAAAILENEDA